MRPEGLLKPHEEEITEIPKKEKAPEKKLEFPQEGKKYLEERYKRYSDAYQSKFTTELVQDFKNLYPKISAQNLERVTKEIENVSYSVYNDNILSFDIETTGAKYNPRLKKALLNLFYTEANELRNLVPFLPIDLKKEHKETTDAMLNNKLQFQQAREKFFRPLLKRKEIKEHFENFEKERKPLVSDLEIINRNQFLSKDQKKEKKKPIEGKLLELSRQRKKLEEEMKTPGILLNFVPGYQKDFEENFGNFKKEFNKKWIEESLDKNLGKLFKDLDKLYEKEYGWREKK